jgi:glycosyltransferase involved in cell wall biosynthesis
MIARHRGQGTWRTKVDRFIALTEFAKTKFVKAGFPANKIAVKPNFVTDTRARDAGMGRDGALFVGRLSPEKGIGTLLTAWRDLAVPLRVAGSGPLSVMMRDAPSPNIAALGNLTRDAVSEEMTRAAFLVMPSEWYEGFPMTLVEAFGRCLPVIASRLGAMAEIVEDGVTGLHFAPGDTRDLAEKVRWAVDHPEEMRHMGTNARCAYEENYSPDVNYEMLIAIYAAAIRETESSTSSQ